MVKRKRQMTEAEDYDDNAIFYTCIGFLWCIVIVMFVFWVFDYAGLLEVDLDKEINRPPVEPVPVLIPEFEGVEPEDYDELIKQHPPKSTMSKYKII